MIVERILKKKGRYVPKVSPDARLYDVLSTLEKEGAGALVVSADGERIDGIVSERDVVRGLKRYGPSVVYKPVSDFMTRKVVTCAPSAVVTEVMSLMRTHHIRHVPVVENGKLAGLISAHDVIAHRLQEVAAEAEGLRSYIGLGQSNAGDHLSRRAA